MQSAIFELKHYLQFTGRPQIVCNILLDQVEVSRVTISQEDNFYNLNITPIVSEQSWVIVVGFNI